VALAAYAAAGVAGANMVTVGITAVRLGIIAFIVPFMFIYEPVLLFEGPYLDILLALVTATVGVIALALGLERWLWGRVNIWISGLLIVAALLLIKPGWITDLIGLGIIVVIWAIRWRYHSAWKEEDARRQKELQVQSTTSSQP